MNSPMGILRQPAVTDFGPSKDPLAHQEHILDFGTDFRLHTTAGTRRPIRESPVHAATGQHLAVMHIRRRGRH